MIAITGGGTGGHLSIAKAVKEALNELGHKPIFIGSINGQDKSWFENDEGFSAKYFLNSGGVVNKKGFGKIKALAQIIKASRDARSILNIHKVTTVFSVGGYSAAPCVFASVDKKLFIHEQNAAIGTLNKFARKFAKGFFCSFDNGADYCGYPVSKEFFEDFRQRGNVKTIIFLGGSQGAKAINDFALSVAKELKEKSINIIHQCGMKNEDEIKQKYLELGVDADVFGFSKNLIQKITQADFAVARAGAGTVFELSANGLPALFVPYPYAAGNHQYYNAKFLADKNLAQICMQENLNKQILFDVLRQDFNETSISLNKINERDAAKKIARFLLA